MNTHTLQTAAEKEQRELRKDAAKEPKDTQLAVRLMYETKLTRYQSPKSQNGSEQLCSVPPRKQEPDFRQGPFQNKSAIIITLYRGGAAPIICIYVQYCAEVLGHHWLCCFSKV